ncbi:MAG: imidazole glycerol phosphate synthase subunit HisH [Alphaproteobacteria bacterium]|nr:imidazole glycerol phosphate synthase subunit HisH [Alphaproteobacteria bacterium]
MSVAVVDSGVANIASVTAALARLGVDADVTADAARIGAASHVILPGVGSAAAAMAQLRAKGLVDTLRGLTQPVLGICLGMQLLFAHSRESGGVDALGVIDGTVEKLRGGPGMPVPHMGWNRIMPRGPHALLRGVDDGAFVYFVHSFAAPAGRDTLAVCDYGEAFTAVAGRDHFFGCQFHPERSGETGAQILKNFLDM